MLTGCSESVLGQESEAKFGSVRKEIMEGADYNNHKIIISNSPCLVSFRCWSHVFNRKKDTERIPRVIRQHIPGPYCTLPIIATVKSSPSNFLGKEGVGDLVLRNKKTNYKIDTVINGDATWESLKYDQYEGSKILKTVRDNLEKSVASRKISIEESSHFLELLDRNLQGYTYLGE